MYSSSFVFFFSQFLYCFSFSNSLIVFFFFNFVERDGFKVILIAARNFSFLSLETEIAEPFFFVAFC